MLPWDYLNEALSILEIDFEVNKPNELEFTLYRPRLRKKSTGSNIIFHELSSGERILMSLGPVDGLPPIERKWIPKSLFRCFIDDRRWEGRSC
jgi:hypothetical protein